MTDQAVVGAPIQFLLHGGDATPGAAVYGDPGTTFPGLIAAVFDDSVVKLDYQDGEGNKQTAEAVVDVVFFDQNGHSRRHHGVFLLSADAIPPQAHESYARFPAPPSKGDARLKTGTPATAGQSTSTPPTSNADATAVGTLESPPNAQNPAGQQGKTGNVSIPPGAGTSKTVTPGQAK